MSATATACERVRVHGARLDATTARVRLEQALAGVELRPDGLPACAWLYVRVLADPLPGGLALGASGGPTAAWERACRAALGAALRSAARPACGPVPAGADAVLFLDEAELLACLGHDLVDGTVGARWWWRSLIARAERHADAAREVWEEHAGHAPAAVELMGVAGAAAFLAALPPGAVPSLLRRMLAASAAEAAWSALAVDGARVVGSFTAGAGADDAGGPETRPPWAVFAPEATRIGLPPDVEALLGLALALRRAPTVARSSAFAAAVREWTGARAARSRFDPVLTTAPAPAPVRGSRVPAGQGAGTRESGLIVEAPRRAGPAAPPRGETPAPGVGAAPAAEAAATPFAVPDHGDPQRGRARPPSGRIFGGPSPAARGIDAPVRESARRAGATAPRIAPGNPMRPPSEPGRQSSVADPGRPRRRVTVERAAVPGRAPRTAASGSAGVPTAPPAMRTPVAMTVPAVVETGLGGTFYLLNLALHLGLYGDFSSPAEPGLALSPWDLLALLGRAILGSPRAEERRDPLWALLARLAGRSPGTPPGAGFRAPRTWRAPIAWLEPFAAAGEWQWSAAGGSLRILHPAGFPAVAVPRRGTAAVQLTGELDRLRRLAPALRDVTPVRRRQRPEPAGALARWTARLAAFGAARLRLALGMDRDAPLADLLLRRRARVLVTHTHLEVQLGLAELPLAVRFAGLDRTPGWVPAAGRTVRFEFA